MYITSVSGKEYSCSFRKDPYMKMFLKNLCLRESCYRCKVKETGICSDITIGDLWGADKILPEMDNTQGISLAVIHTEKGRSFFDQIRGGVFVAPVDYDQAVSYNPPLIRSVKRPQERDRFFPDVNTLNWAKLEKRYVKEKLSLVVKRKISKTVLGRIRRRI